MKLSSHLYFRSNGTLGRYPIIAFDHAGTIVSIEECPDVLRETSHQMFLSGLLLPEPLRSPSEVLRELKKSQTQQEFMQQLRAEPLMGLIEVGQKCPICLLTGFDMRTFRVGELTLRKIITK